MLTLKDTAKKKSPVLSDKSNAGLPGGGKLKIKGTYSLIIYLKSSIKLQVGALGVWDFDGGYYVYVGSALQGIKERVERHIRQAKRLHWHIDYLLASKEATVVGLVVAEVGEKAECKVSASIGAIPGARVTLKGFGSSDCESCKGHLYYFAFMPFRRLLGEVKESYKAVGLEPRAVTNIRNGLTFRDIQAL